MRKLMFAALASAVIGLVGASPLAAQPGPPNRFYGSLTIDGAPAPVGTTVVAIVGGKECGSRATDQAGQYWVDAASAGQTAGCGAPGADVSFRIGTRTATQTSPWNGGTFTKLDLIVSGAGTPGQPFSVAVLNLSADASRCIPPTGQTACDSTRQALWTGDSAAWAAEFARQNKPAPTPDDIFLATYEFRIGANDPPAISSLAKGLSWPKIYITGIKFRGTAAGEADEYIEITNVGGAPQDMTGWRVHAVEGGADFFFSDGTVLEPGAVCRFYTAQTQPDSCPGSINVATSGVWNNDAGSAELWYDPLALLADATRYNANPASQPAPPNLQGVSAPAG